MGDLTQFARPKVVDAIYKLYEKREAAEQWRGHLGCSVLGEECERKLFYHFRWVGRELFDGRMLRLFNTGHRAEGRFVEELRGIGCIVHEVDPSTGKQFRVTIPGTGGHANGSMDGCALGIPDAPKTWHVTEFKTHNAESFKELRSKGVAKAKPQHEAQVHLYMGGTGMERTLYLAENKDTSELYAERIEFDRAKHDNLTAKAVRIVTAVQPGDVTRISDRPEWFKCKFCPARAVCHGARVPAPTCRTCCHATPITEGEDARWYCEHHKRDITLDEQRAGCDEHLTLPGFIQYAEPVDYGPSFVVYKRADNGRIFCNVGATGMPPVELLEEHGACIYTSKELAAAADHRIIGSPEVADLKATFEGAEVVA